MNDRRPFLDAIIASPDDDTPRLVYADWLEENGNAERAEFIRAQCRIDHGELPDCTYGCPRDICLRCRLRKRENGYIAAKGFGLCDGLLGDGWKTEGINKERTKITARFYQRELRTGNLTIDLRRGFIDTVSCDLADWVVHGPSIVREHPVRPHAGMITDRQPFRLGGVTNEFYSWYDWYDDPQEALENIPSPIFSLIEGYDFQQQKYDRYKSFATRDRAMFALASAMISHARGKIPS